MRRLIRSAIRTPDGTILESKHRHDYQSHTDAITKEWYMIDGGLDGGRGSVNIIPAESLCVYWDDPHSLVREHFEWTSYGKDGQGAPKATKLQDLETAHIEAIIEHIQARVNSSEGTAGLMQRELDFRASLGVA